MGGSVRNIHFSGAGTAAYCVHADTIVSWEFDNLWCERAAIHQFHLDARYGTCSWNTLRNIRVSTGYVCSAESGVMFNGYDGGYNVCHNTVINLNVEHAGDAVGLLLGFCDNNTFIDTYINRASSGFTGASSKPGVGYVISGAVYAYSNFFFHLQAGNGGYVEINGQYGGVYNVAQIWGYCTDNAQPNPVLDSEVGTMVVSNGNSFYGVRQVGIGTAAFNHPLEVKNLNTNSRGVVAKLGENGYLATYDDELYILDKAIVNSIGTVIAKVTGDGSALKFENGAFKVYSFDSMTAGVSVPINDAVRAFTVKKLAGVWSYGFCGKAESAVKTGYGTPTGGAQLIDFPGATATLAQTSGALADLLLELKAKGLIQA